MTRALALALLLCGCDSWDSMRHQPKVLPYRPNPFFPAGQGGPPAGTVARDLPSEERPAGPLTRELLDLGERSYNQTCAACHGLAGDSDCPVAGKMALRRPPSLLDAERRAMPDEQLYRTIHEGYGLMPSYRNQLGPRARWATVAYVRALQLSQGTPVAEVPAPLRRQLDRASP